MLGIALTGRRPIVSSPSLDGGKLDDEAQGGAAIPPLGEAFPVVGRAKEESWEVLADGSVTWPIPLSLRLPGGPIEVTLADSPEEWLLTLPVTQQPVAQAFLERNAKAYAFESKAEQAWLIENGFPSLEEVAFFAGLARDATCIRTAQEIEASMRASEAPRPCAHPKLAALSVDAQIRELDLIGSRTGDDPRPLVIGGSSSLPPEVAEASALRSEASILVDKGVGAYRFYQWASLSRLSPASDGSPHDPSDRETIALALAFACEGDHRMGRLRAPELWSRAATATVIATMNMLDVNLRRPDGRAVCGYSQRIGFPSAI